MSQVPHTIPLKNQIRNHWIVAVSALLALLATAAVVLVLAIDGGSTDASTPVAQSSHPAARSDGGPDESAVAASVGSRTNAGVDESRIAVSIGSAGDRAPTPASRPDESRIAASIGH